MPSYYQGYRDGWTQSMQERAEQAAPKPVVLRQVMYPVRTPNSAVCCLWTDSYNDRADVPESYDRVGLLPDHY